jgi:hypothetical protein
MYDTCISRVHRLEPALCAEKTYMYHQCVMFVFLERPRGKDFRAPGARVVRGCVQRHHVDQIKLHTPSPRLEALPHHKQSAIAVDAVLCLQEVTA